MGLIARILESRAHPSSHSGWGKLLGIGGPDTYTGRRIDERSALSLSTVYACIRAISEPASMLPMLMYERTSGSGGGKERAEAHPVYRLLKQAPNPEQTPIEWKDLMLSHAAAWGNGYSEIEWSKGGFPLALWPLNTAKMEPKREKGKIWYYYTTPDGKRHRLAAHQVLHLRGRGGNSVVGYNITQMYAKESIGLGLATEEHGARFFGNGSRSGVVLKHPGKLSDEAYDRLLNSWESKHQGLSNSHRAAILEEGLDVDSIGIPPEEAQFLQTRSFQVEEICRWFNVPPHMVQHLDKATFSNIEHQSLDFVIHTLGPWLTRFSQVAERDLLLEDERQRHLIEFMTDALLKGDIDSRYNAYATGRQWGWLSVNEIRASENRNPIEGGDEYMIPLNMVPAGAAPGDLPEDTGENDDAAAQSEERGADPCGCNTHSRRNETRADEDEEPEDVRKLRVARQRLARSYINIYEDVAGRVVRREVNDVRRAVDKHLRKRSVADFREWLGEFYRDFPQVLIDAFLPVMRTYAEQILANVAAELDEDEDGLTDELLQFVDEYLESMANGMVASSRNQIEALLDEPEEDDDPADAIEERLDGWSDTQPHKIALRQVTQALNAVVLASYAVYGIAKYRWSARGDSCPFCKSVDGKVIRISEAFFDGGESIDAGDGSKPMLVRRKTKYGPLHGGCDCVTVAIQ